MRGMNVSELKKNILEGIRTSGLQEWAFTINDYDGIMDYKTFTDEDIDELATAILNEINNQPILNPNQQIVLDWLKNRYTGNADPFGIAACLFSQPPRSEVIVATLELARAEQAQVLKIFANWTLEQEEERWPQKRTS